MRKVLLSEGYEVDLVDRGDDGLARAKSVPFDLVLTDLKLPGLSGMELELIGKFSAPDLFTVDPIHTRAMFVHKNGKRYLITYWCELCAIRTYTPGKCWCCQQETQLDLRESDKP